MIKKKRAQKEEKAINKDCSIKKIDSHEWKIVYNLLKSYDCKKYA